MTANERGPVGGAGELPFLLAKLRGIGEAVRTTNIFRGREITQLAGDIERAAKAPQGVPSERAALLWLKENIGPKLDYERAKAVIANALLAAPPALPVPGPVSDNTIHRGIFPPRMFAPVLQEHQDKAIRILRPYISGAEFGEVVALVAQAIADAREAAAPKPAPHPTDGISAEEWRDYNEKTAESQREQLQAARQRITELELQLAQPTPAPGAERPAHLSEDDLISFFHDHATCKCQQTQACALKQDAFVREALAAAPPAPEEEEPMPCERCQENAETVWIPTGFSGEREPLCGKCISLMLDEGHASAERVRELIAKIQKWRDEGWMKETTSETIIRKRAYDRVLGAVLALLPPSTGEKS